MSGGDAVLSIGVACIEAPQQQDLVITKKQQMYSDREFCTHNLIILFQTAIVQPCEGYCEEHFSCERKLSVEMIADVKQTFARLRLRHCSSVRLISFDSPIGHAEFQTDNFLRLYLTVVLCRPGCGREIESRT